MSNEEYKEYIIMNLNSTSDSRILKMIYLFVINITL